MKEGKMRNGKGTINKMQIEWSWKKEKIRPKKV
jgi:hypothetical protein